MCPNVLWTMCVISLWFCAPAVAISLIARMHLPYVRPLDMRGGEVKHGSFKVDVWGPSVGEGTSGPLYCTMPGVAKRNGPESTYAVANEYICGRLGYMIGLPVPPGVIVRTDDGKLAYVSLRFGSHSERPPEIIAPQFVDHNPKISAGVVAFDCWIANQDRHEGNLSYSRFGLPPVVFDHDTALFGASGKPIERLCSLRDDGLAGSCISEHITQSTAKHFPIWAERIAAIRDEQIGDICQDVVCEGGISLAESAAALDFLVYRKPLVLKLLRESAELMPLVRQWVLT